MTGRSARGPLIAARRRVTGFAAVVRLGTARKCGTDTVRVRLVTGAEVSVLTATTELEAEIALSKLRAAGIPARVVPRSFYGMPPTVLPASHASQNSRFDVVVRDRDAAAAREALATEDDEPLPPRGMSPIVRAIAIVILLAFVFTAVVSLGAFLQPY